MTESPYANPQPYDNPDLERSILAGRIKVARSIHRQAERSGNTRRAAEWATLIDVLLDHFNAADDRAVTAGLDRMVAP